MFNWNRIVLICGFIGIALMDEIENVDQSLPKNLKDWNFDASRERSI